MEFEVKKIDVGLGYRLLSSVVVPRPIAWVTTVDKAMRTNAAPFSFFNLMGDEPPVVALGIARSEGAVDGLKDTARNILATNEFVINIVPETLVVPMVQTAADFPSEISELEALRIKTQPSVEVRPPRIVGAVAHLECRLVTTLEIGQTRVTLGEVVHFHIDDQWLDRDTLRVRTAQAGVVGRMHGGAWYARTTDLFEQPRLSYEQLAVERKTGL